MSIHHHLERNSGCLSSMALDQVRPVGRTGRLRLLLAAALALLAALCPWSPALAQQALVARDVTVREQADRRSPAVAYATPGQPLSLLDDGVRIHGYYHVQLGNGRTGWIYQTFVHRGPLAPPSGATSTDVANVYFINVDQANSALLEFPCGAVLIDAGARDQVGIDHLTNFLESFFARRPDLDRHIAALFITHTHKDHNFALKAVAERFHVDHYIHNGYLTGSGSPNAHWMTTFVSAQSPQIPSEAVEESTIGPNGRTDPTIDPVNCPRVDPDIRILSGSYKTNPGWSADDFKNQNNHSLVIKVTYGAARFLFSGDMETAGIDLMLSRPSIQSLLATDVWLAGHHGSYNGTTSGLLAALKPQIVVISSGDPAVHDQWTAWDYGHPRRSVVQMIDQTLQRARVPAKDVLVADAVHVFTPYHVTHALYDTAWDGDIHMRAKADGTIDIVP